MRRRFDIRHIPLTLLFLVATAAILVFLLRSYLWLFRFNLAEFFLQVLVLVPVAMFFAALATLILWYLFRIFLPSVLRYRRLRIIRYRRSLRRGDQEQDHLHADDTDERGFS